MSRTGHDERRLTEGKLNPTLTEGACFYLVERKWWETWCAYVGISPDNCTTLADHKEGDGAKPGKLDNSFLANPESKVEGELAKGINEHSDFEWVGEEAWGLLKEWYDASPEFSRVVITVGLRKMEILEMYPAYLNIALCGSDGNPEQGSVVCLSQHKTLKDVLNQFNPHSTKPEGRIWLENEKKDADGTIIKKWTKVDASSLNAKIETFQFASGANVLLEYKNRVGDWIREEEPEKPWDQFEIGDVIDCMDTAKKWYQSNIRDIKPGKILVHYMGWPARWDTWIQLDSGMIAPKGTHTQGVHKAKPSRSGRYGRPSLQRQHSYGSPPERGAVGLRNLGNTCFMNTTLQCLSNTPGLTDYFFDQSYVNDINRENPLGWNGKIAEAYGELMADVWGGEYRTVTPSNFKEVIGEFQPRFTGYQQHDSSELLSFLLDGLHEDLNRVLKKPYTESVESDGRPDKEVADLAWSRHLMRNNSIIVDHLHGQFKSRVVCPTCNRESITFDPFQILSVPIPGDHKSRRRNRGYGSSKKVNITVVLKKKASDPSTPHPMTVNIEMKYGTKLDDLQGLIAAKLGTRVKPKDLRICEVYKERVYKVFNKDNRRGGITISDIDDIWAWEAPEQTAVTTHDYTYVQVLNVDAAGLGDKFGIPTLVAIPENRLDDVPHSYLKEKISDAIAPFLQGGTFPDGTSLTDFASIHVCDSYGHSASPVPEGGSCKLSGATRYGKERALCLKWTPAGKKLVLTGNWSEFVDPSKSAATDDSKDAKKTERKGPLNVYDCIRKFCKEETLQPGDEWYCRTCKEHICANKKFDLWKAPPILVVHFKRFSYTSLHRDKIEEMIYFPTEGLDLSEFIVNSENKENAVYDLYAVSNHSGGMGGGHYTAYCKNIIDDQWYHLNDSSVTELSSAEATQTAKAYVLFYKRRNFNSTGVEPASDEKDSKSSAP